MRVAISGTGIAGTTLAYWLDATCVRDSSIAASIRATAVALWTKRSLRDPLVSIEYVVTLPSFGSAGCRAPAQLVNRIVFALEPRNRPLDVHLDSMSPDLVGKVCRLGTPRE